MLRVTEGPFFSEVVTCYEHVHQVVRLYNLEGEVVGEMWASVCDVCPLHTFRVHTSVPNRWSF